LRSDPARKARRSELWKKRYLADPERRTMLIERGRQWALANPEKAAAITERRRVKRLEKRAAARLVGTDLLEIKEPQ
jgi:hypothetical protein